MDRPRPGDVDLEKLKPPVCSIASLACPVVLVALGWFLTTPQGNEFNRQLFERLYTLGAILMTLLWGFVFIGGVILGIGLGIRAWHAKETPAWLPKLAISISIALPVVVWLAAGYVK